MLRQKIRSFRTADKGVAALEFAIILPVMMTMWLGTFEITQAINANRRVTLVGRTVADLTSRLQKVNAAGIADIFSASKAVFSPLDSSQLTMVITSVKRTGGQNKVVWSKVPDGQTTPGAYAPNAIMSLPSNILVSDNETVIVAEVTYSYKPISHWISMPVTVPLKQKMYMIPRASAEVTWY